MNDLKLIGRLTKDPEAPTEYQGGSKMLRFSLAVKREYKTKEDHIPFEKELCTLEEMSWGPFTEMTKEERVRIDALLREVE